MTGINSILFICLVGFNCLHKTNGVKITSLDVPKNAWNSVKLNCRYDLEGAALYGVKWYKDGIEFFRCLADGTVQEFPLKDIQIYHSASSQLGSCFFELTAISSKSGGEYMCEVSLDWPTFQTVTQSSTLHITEPSKIVQTQAWSAEAEEESSSENTHPIDAYSKATSLYLSNMLILSTVNVTFFIFLVFKF